MSSGSYAQTSQRGYVLILSAGVLLFISVLVLGMATSLRLDAQLTLREKEQLQSEYGLRGGLQYLLAQLAVTRHAEQMGGALDARVKEELGLWRAEGGPYSVTLKSGTVIIRLSDAGALPDANQLTETEWEKLFGALAGASESTAKKWAHRMVDERTALAKQSGRGGFTSIQEVLSVPEIPQEVRYGKGDGSAQSLGLKDILLVGTEHKQLEVNRSPLILFYALLPAATPDQIAKFDEARRNKKLTLQEATRLLGQGSAILYEGQSRLLRVQISFAVQPEEAQSFKNTGLALVATLMNDGGNYRLVEQRVGAAASLLSAEQPALRAPPAGSQDAQKGARELPEKVEPR